LPVNSLQDTLVFSFIGYQTREVPINGRTQIDAVLTSQAVVGEDVVVVGYGTQRRRDVTGSVGSISTEDIESTSVTGVDQAITGKVAGVQVQNVSGTPGGGPSIRIRGIGSIGAGNDPLFVVDGFPIPNSPNTKSNPLNSISPSQIESIEVLKDASATAIYGSRGANGVVLITTKEGTPQTQIQVNSSIGIQSVRERGMVEVMNARQWAQFMKERMQDNIRFNQGREPTEQDIPEMYRNPEQYGEGTDWQDQIFENAIMHEQNFSISTGNETIRAMVSANFMDQRGTVLETGYRRYNLRANIDANLSENISVGLRIAPSLENQKLAPEVDEPGRFSAIASSFLVNPIASVRKSDGTLTSMITGAGMLPFVNPVLKLKEVDEELSRKRSIVNTYAEYEVYSGITLRSTFNVDWNNAKTEFFKPTTVGVGFRSPPTAANARFTDQETLNWLNENTIRYESVYGDHNIRALAGLSIQQETIEVGNFSATNFPDNEIRTFNAAPTIGGNTNIGEWSLVSVLGRINYDFKDKYLITATIRRDGSSRFGADNRWGSFPSFSVGWRISEEKFMREVNLFNNLLIRGGYGLSGNFNIGNYSHLGTVSTANYTLNSQEVSGRTVTNLGNPNLGWEEVQQVNLGLNMSMLEDRLNFTLDAYEKITSNMLLNIETPFTSGFNEAVVNRGEVTNQGIEFEVNSTIVRNSIVNWDLSFNIAHNSNEVTKLDSPILAPVSQGQHITEEGYPIGQFYGFEVEGIYNTMEEIQNHIPNGDAIPGQWRYKDVNGDGRTDPFTDFVRIGNAFPDFTWGLNSSLNYKNFDFSVSVTGSQGGETLRTDREDHWNLMGIFNVTAEAQNRWRSPENPGDGIHARAISYNNIVHRYNKSVWVEDNSHIWIRNITLGHTFSSNQIGFLNSMGANELRAYLNVHNLWISNTDIQNPEESVLANDPLQPGQTRNGNYPIARMFKFGININF
ncbi:SusC/RagA family TonB-linked outer membrane protein, partial [Halalkalibaculum sp. DA3122]|uniref:SusC/RagA family TonB-linked outer membrane protein n=1 Tax=unclassified Halalkalibaculum TaxID=2964617 RepID=UPI003754870A